MVVAVCLPLSALLALLSDDDGVRVDGSWTATVFGDVAPNLVPAAEAKGLPVATLDAFLLMVNGLAAMLEETNDPNNKALRKWLPSPAQLLKHPKMR